MKKIKRPGKVLESLQNGMNVVTWEGCCCCGCGNPLVGTYIFDDDGVAVGKINEALLLDLLREGLIEMASKRLEYRLADQSVSDDSAPIQ